MYVQEKRMKSCLPRVPARGEHIYHDILSMQSVLMRDVFAALLKYGQFNSQFHPRPLAIVAALLRYGEFASQFHLRPLANTDPTWTDRNHTAH